MRLIKVLFQALCALSAACENSTNSAKSSGVANVASTKSDTSGKPMLDPVQTSSSDTLTGSGRVGGGGGGSAEPRFLVQKIALDQVTGTQEQSYVETRKIVRSADLTIESESPQTSLQKVASISETNGGFVVESQENSSDVKTTQHDTVTVTIRVPADKFSSVLDEIRKTGTRVISENVKGEDVTEEFIDIEARLKAQKALESQFLEIMKRANSVNDALDVQRQLADVRGEIEKVEGRKRFLENRSSLSTIKLKLQTPTLFAANSTGFVYRLTVSFSTGFDFAMNFVLGLVTFLVGILPLAIVFGLPGYFIVRYFWRKQTRPRSVGEIAMDELDAD
jgi:hypothetical protein